MAFGLVTYECHVHAARFFAKNLLAIDAVRPVHSVDWAGV